MKKIKTILFFVLITIPNICLAEDNNYKIQWKTSLISQYLSKPGFTLSNHRPITTNQLTIFYNNFFRFGFLGFNGLNNHGIDHKKNFSNEIDAFVGLNKAFSSINFDAEISYFGLNRFRKSSDDIWVFDGQIKNNLSLFHPYFSIRHFGEVGAKSHGKKGWFYWLGAEKNLPFKKLPINLDIQFAFTDGALNRQSGFIYSRVKTSTKIQFKKIVISPFVIFQIPAGDQNGDKRDYIKEEETAAGISFTFNF